LFGVPIPAPDNYSALELVVHTAARPTSDIEEPGTRSSTTCCARQDAIRSANERTLRCTSDALPVRGQDITIAPPTIRVIDDSEGPAMRRPLRSATVKSR
jgi:hypothetical protein